jgi:hypothetical protein
VAALVVFALEGDAQACGGCFGPPPPPNQVVATVVTDHQMVLSISSKQTTLYDQIKYQGSPDSFAWVLPISGEVKVGLSSDTVFQILDQATEVTVQAPPLNCPPPPNCGGGFGGNASLAAAPRADDTAGAAPPVTVTHMETVGPYETVQLHSTDANALTNWLAQHNYAIPDDIKPVIGAYVEEKFDFLALKLVPGQGVSAMRPVRVTFGGAAPQLPLRMVAAGTGDKVGISLWVIGDGRWEPQNFPFFVITEDELIWDWSTQSSNYAQLRQDREAAQGSRAWEMMSSIDFDPTVIQSAIRNGFYFTGYRGGFGAAPAPASQNGDYIDVKDAQGVVTETADQVREDDLTVLFEGKVGTARITRLHGDLAHQSLAADLLLQASSSQAEVALTRQVTKEKNQPLCTVVMCGGPSMTLPRDQAQAYAASSGGGEIGLGRCDASPRRGTAGLAGAGVLCSLLGLASWRARRRRARQDAR